MLPFLLQWGIFSALALYLAGALSSLIFESIRDSPASSISSHAFAASAGLAGVVSSIALLFSGIGLELHSAVTIGIGPSILSLRVDALSAFFVAIISVIALAASIYGIGYQKQYYASYRLSSFGFFYNLFLMGMIVVVCANNALLFLFAWELMSVASFFLVIFERKEEANIRAGVLYILVTQLGTAFLFAAFLMLHSIAGSWDFDTIRDSISSISPFTQNAILALALFGLATKAGVIPLHIWLPEAHPAAPSHVSALMSGVMIKTAIFMIIRFFFDFFPSVSPNWGLIILALGAISSLLGVLYALSEHDIKRLLAFHSVENIGIILLGVGASITFFSYGATALGIIALAAGLYHTVNHALFKALLFLSAGSVVHATHTRNMEEYGGLIKAMPWTAVFFLIGAVAISGLPPFNGFMSEWLTFQSLFLGVASLPLKAKLVFLVGISSLAFTGGLAAACFVKAFGAIFLARPRHVHSHVRESEASMQLGMGLLATLTALFGLAATSITPVLANIVMSLRGLEQSPAPLVSPLQVISLGNFANISMLVVAISLAAGILATGLFVWLVSRKRRVVISRTWDCGFDLGPRMEITATGFSRSLLVIFQGLLRPALETNVEYDDAAVRYFTKSKKVSMYLPDLYRTYLYLPAASIIERGGKRIRLIQTGNLNTYLLYMFCALIALLYWALK